MGWVPEGVTETTNFSLQAVAMPSLEEEVVLDSDIY